MRFKLRFVGDCVDEHEFKGGVRGEGGPDRNHRSHIGRRVQCPSKSSGGSHRGIHWFYRVERDVYHNHRQSDRRFTQERALEHKRTSRHRCDVRQRSVDDMSSERGRILVRNGAEATIDEHDCVMSGKTRVAQPQEHASHKGQDCVWGVNFTNCPGRRAHCRRELKGGIRRRGWHEVGNWHWGPGPLKSMMQVSHDAFSPGLDRFDHRKHQWALVLGVDSFGAIDAKVGAQQRLQRHRAACRIRLKDHNARGKGQDRLDRRPPASPGAMKHRRRGRQVRRVGGSRCRFGTGK
ncbi:hypothetical protein H310_06220 [Aphanomyces invadans]|uniref:Uncharacterized protein n=1 Tax=Aphanomyces invadans TaxID=157072 RepID=A0A024U5M9_9STRA|nr:hypothetical protein H310_06220 [Aphanomyces invadans]ETW01574.1 hypothetical protein H310_06220 [Aphanomyces invadans]|eukprot:XP_008869422.1 hypothetical protein H310_06220 [Aphanomyces invadans]